MATPSEIHKLPHPTTLPTLPYDLLHAIIAHIPDACSLAHLSRACKSLHRFVTAGRGWQIFVQSRFPSLYHSIAPDADWRCVAEELTLLSRNYDRRGFVAQALDPDLFVPHAQGRFGRNRGHGRWRGGAGRDGNHHRWNAVSGKGQQTVGFHPVLDASSGGEKGEILAVGAGQDLLLRRRQGKVERWWLFEDRANVAGRDDITALKLVPDGTGGEAESVLVGRSNGALSVVTLRTEKATTGGIAAARVDAVLDTQGRRNVRASSLLLTGEHRLVASVLGNDIVALHQLPSVYDGAGKVWVPVASTLEFGATDEQPWNVQFLGPGMMAVGKTCAQPLAVYAVTPTGLSAEPVRSFLAEECVGSKTSSVQPIAEFQDMRGSPDVFLAGWCSGATLLHDLRAPEPCVASFIDHLDPTSAIYSLLPLGRERIIVGGARHSLLKVFDIRMPSGRLYFSPTSSPSHTSETTAGWATYLTNHSHNSGFSRRSHRPERDSPVYSLAAGSVGGAKVFVGIEGGIWEFDFLGDSVGGVLRKPQQARFCTMYEFVGRTKLWKQGGEELLGSGGVMGAEGVLDGRWRVGGRV